MNEYDGLVIEITNPASGKMVYYELKLSGSGLYVTIHKTHPKRPADPYLVDAQTAMAAVHIDYYEASDDPMRDQVKLQLWDENTDKNQDPGWNVPPERREGYRDASIVLVDDVLAWEPETGDEQ